MCHLCCGRLRRVLPRMPMRACPALVWTEQRLLRLPLAVCWAGQPAAVLKQMLCGAP